MAIQADLRIQMLSPNTMPQEDLHRSSLHSQTKIEKARNQSKAAHKTTAARSSKVRGKFRSDECKSSRGGGARKKTKQARRRTEHVKEDSDRWNETGGNAVGASRHKRAENADEGSIGSQVAVNSADMNPDQASDRQLSEHLEHQLG